MSPSAPPSAPPPAIVDQVLERIAPGDPLSAPAPVALAALVAVVLVGVPALWRPARLGVTIVHELGHAAVGILAGRRFTGFVVNGDMSGHAVTVGPSRGLGRVLCTWSGYPAPAIVGAALTAAALRGLAPATLLALALCLLAALLFARSLGTAVTVIGAIAVCAAGWWWGSAGAAIGLPLAPALLLCVGSFLLLGAWRHLGAVITHPRGIDDPQSLERLTSVPAGLWNASFILVIALCTAVVGLLLRVPLEPWLPDMLR